jgi:hypothetical protein
MRGAIACPIGSSLWCVEGHRRDRHKEFNGAPGDLFKRGH